MASAPEDDRPLKRAVHEIGQDLTLLSVDELAERITLLRREVSRVENVRDAKLASRGAADAFFKT